MWKLEQRFLHDGWLRLPRWISLLVNTRADSESVALPIALPIAEPVALPVTASDAESNTCANGSPLQR
jgi:hypothetical protein